MLQLKFRLFASAALRPEDRAAYLSCALEDVPKLVGACRAGKSTLFRQLSRLRVPEPGACRAWYAGGGSCVRGLGGATSCGLCLAFTSASSRIFA